MDVARWDRATVLVFTERGYGVTDSELAIKIADAHRRVPGARKSLRVILSDEKLLGPELVRELSMDDQIRWALGYLKGGAE